LHNKNIILENQRNSYWYRNKLNGLKNLKRIFGSAFSKNLVSDPLIQDKFVEAMQVIT
jgi:hypothetical protein